MIWYICGAIAFAAIAMSVYLVFDKKRGSLRVAQILLLCIAATYFIYLPPFWSTVDLVSALIGNVINVLQVISLDAGYLEFYETIQENISFAPFAKLYMMMLGAVHIGLPALSAVTAVTVLLRYLSAAKYSIAKLRNRTLYVFSEVNERSIMLAQSLAGRKSEIVFCQVTDKSQLSEDNLSCTACEESIVNLRPLRRRRKDAYFFFIGENEDESLGEALQTIALYADADLALQKRIHVLHFSQGSDYSVYIDSAHKGSLDVQCINECDNLVFNLLDRHPLYEAAKDGKIHVLLHGLTPISEDFLRTALWVGQLNGYSLKISVVGANIGEAIAKMKVATPGLFSGRYDVDVYDCPTEAEVIETVKGHCADANYIVASDESDNDTMDCAVALRRLFYKLDPKFANCPPIYCYIRDPGKAKLTAELKTAESNEKRKMSYDLTPFGDLSEVYNYDRLTGSDIERLAKNIHLAYEEIFSPDGIDPAQAIKGYYTFEVNKRSNRACALHIRYKLNLLGLDYAEESDPREAKDLKPYMTPETIELLGRAEHDRWVAFYEAEGWEQSTREQVIAYRESGISKGRHNCPILRMHPYICDYDLLEDLSLELEGKDTRVYDSELILRIPDILGDKWGMGGKKFKIVKKSEIGGTENGN